MNRVYKALNYIEKKLKTKKFLSMDKESAEFDWAFEDLYSDALEKYDLSDDERDCLNSMVDDLF